MRFRLGPKFDLGSSPNASTCTHGYARSCESALLKRRMEIVPTQTVLRLYIRPMVSFPLGTSALFGSKIRIRSEAVMKTCCVKLSLAVLLIIANLPNVCCMAQDIRLSQYIHTAWRVQDGVFNSAPTSIAQTTDGYLWIGTETTGLLRFDGVQFVPWESPSGSSGSLFPVHSLTATSDGSLWVGKRNVMRIKDGKTTTYPQLDELARPWAILEDPNGGVWISSYGSRKHTPLCHFSDRESRCFSKADGLPCSQGNALFRDRRGNLWQACNEKIVTGLPGKFTSTELPLSSADTNHANVGAFLDQPDGSMLVGRLRAGKNKGLQVYRNRRWTTYKIQGLDGSTLAVSALYRLRDGSFLIGTIDRGIFRVHGQFVDHFGASEGLSSDSVIDILEDRESNVWIETVEGLDRLRLPKVITFSRREGLTHGAPVLAGRNGAIFVGAPGGLDEIQGNSISSLMPRDLPGTVVEVLLEDRARRLWINVDRTLVVREGARLRVVTNHNGTPVGNLYQLIEDGAGGIWGVRLDWTLIHIRGYVASEERIRPPGALVKALGRERDGSLIVTFEDGAILNYKDGMAKTIVPAGGPRLWMPTRLPGGQLIGWADTRQTIAAYQDGKFQELGSKNGLPCNGPNDFFYDKQGTLWLHLSCGLVAIDNVELERIWKDPNAKISYRRFDGTDGFHSGSSDFEPRSAQSLDGRLWFSNGSSLEMIDPKNIATNVLPPPVHVESIKADRKANTPQPSIELPRLTRDVEIDYTALSLSIPEKVHFRYRLDKHDKDWQDAGTRRAAFYNDLPPGNYRFQVIASNNDGIWNTTGDTVSFFIPPAFYQTTWFNVLLAITVAALMWSLYLLRLRQATANVQKRLLAQMEERERIARELHDTLLQGFQGIALRVQGVTKRMPIEDPLRGMMEEVLDRADEVLLEGRQRVRDLRQRTANEVDLADRLTKCGEELSKDHVASFSLAIIGVPVVLEYTVQEEAYRIAAEALTNAFRHASASKIEVEITYDSSGLRISVRDDGGGIDNAMLMNGHSGHWGLTGMRERANAIRAVLNIWSCEGAGTEVGLAIPAPIAYPRKQKSITSEKAAPLA
jgi:signal transduction histidine kinase/ligand-binding sensor domain-containing protein